MKKATISALVVSTLLTAPFAAQAAGAWHQENSEIGYSTYSNHASAGKSRAQVVAELSAAKSDKSRWFLMNLNAAKPGWSKQGTDRTREDALREVQEMTPAEKARLDEIYTYGQ